ncbi:MAG: hypothetical protein RO257_00820 [Candidatus Kapabacteria bacterium]|nr:hypothetical protein [Candidatus Kapabacteria bacterium]
MKNLLINLFIGLLLFTSVNIVSMDNISDSKEFYKISKAKEGLYFIYFDSIPAKPFITKGTIVEFEDYVALIEISISDHKLSTDTLIDHTEAGVKTIKSIQNYFPEKPLKYLLSSHWHPHSIASVIPFISKGIIVITTRSNFNRLNDFIDTATYEKYKEFIKFVENDSLVLKDRQNEIIAYKINNQEYTSVPTEDFLYFYMPKSESFHTSCIYQRYPKFMVQGKEFISPRTEDLIVFLRKKNISPKYIISINPFHNQPDGLILADTMNNFINNGILPSEIEKYIVDLSESNLLIKSDSIFKEFMKNSIPKFIIHKLIYNLAAKKELTKALTVAKFHAYYFPSDPNSWDTLGEIYYFMDEIPLAKRYASESVKINSKFTGGENVWKKDLEKHKIMWEKLNP